MRRATWREADTMRRLVDEATDAVLSEYSKLMSATHEQVAKGYGRASAGFGGGGGLSDFDDLARQVDSLVAKAAQAIIYGSLSLSERTAINAVYIGGGWDWTKPLDLSLLEAVTRFEKLARSKGIL